MQNILDRLVNVASRHIGDENLKKMYAVSLLSLGINNPDEPLHIHCHGSPESGKTNLQTLFLDIVPNEHKDNASDFSPRVLMYANLNPGTVISLNDKTFTDPMCSLLNQVCDSTSWRLGRICACTVGHERVNLVFPKRTLFFCNSNKPISQYSIHEVDPNAVESRFMTFEKKYTEEQKKNVFVKRSAHQEQSESEIEDIRSTLKEMFKNPKTIACSEEIRNLIWNKSKEMGINSIRQIGRNLTICQVFALVSGRQEVSLEDVESTFVLLKEQRDLKISNMETIEIKNIEIIKNELLPESIFSTLKEDKKLLYTCKEIQRKIKQDIKATLNYAKSEGIIGYEVLKIGATRIPTECYFVAGI